MHLQYTLGTSCVNITNFIFLERGSNISVRRVKNHEAFFGRVGVGQTYLVRARNAIIFLRRVIPYFHLIPVFSMAILIF